MASPGRRKPPRRKRVIASRTGRVRKRRPRSSLSLVDVDDKGTRQSRVHRPRKSNVITMSDDPLEKSSLEREPLPTGYVFVTKGDVYITRHCRSKTKQSQQIVYVVYNNAGKRTLGIRVPTAIYQAVLQAAVATAKSRSSAVQIRDAKDLSRARKLLRKQFPVMPDDSLELVLNHAFHKGSGRVGRTSTTTDERKAFLAVEAHIRHTHTPYEKLLDAGMERKEARESVRSTVQRIKKAWEGSEEQTELLPVRST